MKTDLERLEKLFNSGMADSEMGQLLDAIPYLIAELRAAREVMKRANDVITCSSEITGTSSYSVYRSELFALSGAVQTYEAAIGDKV